MKKVRRGFMVSLIAFSLMGCFDENIIETVKGMKYDNIDPTLTLGNALDTRKMCKEVQWWTSTDDRNRNVVNYSCELTGFDSYYAERNNNIIDAYIANNQGRLEQLKQDAKYAKERVALDKKYVTFIEHLDKQNIVAALARIKKETPAISVMSRFAFETPDENLQSVEMAPELVSSFNLAAKIYSTELMSKDYGSDFVSSYFNTALMRNFETLIDSINAGQTAAEAFAAQKVLLEENAADAEEAAGKAETLEYQFTKEGIAYRRQTLEANLPVKVIQRLVFAPTDAKPVVLSCELDFYTPNSKEKVAYKKTFNDSVKCLTESYQSTFDKTYNDIFKAIYDEHVGR